MTDFYSILGVDLTSNNEVIVSAYRRLAMKWHPDRHLDPIKKADAELQFKKIQRAYNTLSDARLRQAYDHTLRGARAARQSAPGEDFAEQFRRTAERQRERRRQEQEQAERKRRENLPKGADVRKRASISIMDAINGGQVEISDGGARSTKEARVTTIQTPAGVINGSVIRGRERGKPSPAGGLNGDFLITLSIRPEGGWKCLGADLHGPVKIGFSVAMLGGPVEVKLPTGKRLMVNVPPMTNAGKRIRLAGQGLHHAVKGVTGDVVLLVSIILPASKRRLTPEMEAVLRQIDGVTGN